jgi:hypothetical protein
MVSHGFTIAPFIGHMRGKKNSYSNNYCGLASFSMNNKGVWKQIHSGKSYFVKSKGKNAFVPNE